MPRYSINIEFDEAINGVEKEVLLNGKKRKIKIPPGVDDGSRIQFNDFILSINVRSSSIFERDGADVYVAVPISYSTAVLGGKIEAPTLSGGNIKLKVRAGTQSGSLIRLRGEGIKKLGSSGNGDLYVKLVIEIPKKLSRKQKSLLHDLQKEGI